MNVVIFGALFILGNQYDSCCMSQTKRKKGAKYVNVHLRTPIILFQKII